MNEVANRNAEAGEDAGLASSVNRACQNQQDRGPRNQKKTEYDGDEGA
jgi:hypothetical protein